MLYWFWGKFWSGSLSSPRNTEANNSNLDNDIFKLEILFVLFLKNIKKKQHEERSHILNALVEAYGKKKNKKRLGKCYFLEEQLN